MHALVLNSVPIHYLHYTLFTSPLHFSQKYHYLELTLICHVITEEN
jgi:hypothetical protein